METTGDPVMGMLLLAALLAIYFGPTLCAIRRHCRGRGAIFFLNLILGWTLVGWVVTFIWANAAPKE